MLAESLFSPATCWRAGDYASGSSTCGVRRALQRLAKPLTLDALNSIAILYNRMATTPRRGTSTRAHSRLSGRRACSASGGDPA